VASGWANPVERKQRQASSTTDNDIYEIKTMKIN